MRLGIYLLLACAAAGVLLVWTGCTCDPVYPPEAGDRCDSVGDKDCDLDRETDESTNVLICVDTFRWAVESPCDDFGMACTQIDGEPVCVARPCVSGETRCTTDYTGVRTCNEYATWNAAEACNDGRVCAVRDGSASCTAPSCREGESRCSAEGESIETCDESGNWLVAEDCPLDWSCETGELVPICVEGPTCSEQNELEQRCNPRDPVWVQECLDTGIAGDPVYGWVDTLDCSTITPDYVCQQEGDGTPFCFPPP